MSKNLARSIYALIAAMWAFAALPAHAGPFVALIPIVVGAVAGTGLVAAAITIALTAAVSMLTKQKKQRPPGIMIEQTLTGGTNSRSMIFGIYATSGSLVTPNMSHGTVDKTPNANLTKVIAVADMPVTGLSRVIINGEYIPLISAGTSGQGARYNFGGKYSGKGFVIFYDGNQSAANPYLTSNYGSYIRPWQANRIGRGVSYAIFSFSYDAEVYKGEPDVRLEVYGMKLYDVRKDSTMGGVGNHRWNNPSTYEFTENPLVMVYNILRGIEMPDGSKYGGEASADDLPVANWAAAMNVADSLLDGQPRYRAALEFSVGDEPADTIEELLKAASTQIVEIGGTYKVRCGPPSLPVMFITDEDWIVSKDSELDPFPSIHASKNTIRATFPHPEEVWQQHDAPMFTNPDYVARDDGVELVADLSFPACPFPVQVQRNMRAWLEDDQRLIRHSGTLSHRAFALEPLDTIAWTSERNGYIDKWFEVGGASINPYTLNVAPAIREVDPSDYDWDPDMELPDPVGDGSWELPEAQSVEAFAVEPWSIRDNDSDARRPAIRCTWDIEGAIDATAIRIEVRLMATGEEVSSMTVANVGDGQAVISEGILPATSYEVRARYLVDRPTLWTIWWSITTGNILLGKKDFDFDALLEELGESAVLPQITNPVKQTMIQQIIDAAYNDHVTRSAAEIQQRAFSGVYGNVADIYEESVIRLEADEAFTSSLTVQISRIDNNAAAIVDESITRANADSALTSSLNSLSVNVGSNTSAITSEAIARANADTALGIRIDTVEATFVTEGEVDTIVEAAVSTEAIARANADTALAGQITTVSSRLNNAGGTGITIEQAFITTASSIDGLEGQYTLRINSNGRISGFGLASGATGSEFAILADRFVVADPGNNSTLAYPFQVVGGVVYIRKAMIQQITADQIDVTRLSAISSVMGDLDIRPAVTGGDGRIRVYDEDDDLRVVLGRLS